MEVHLTPELQATLDRLASAQVRETLDSRYDDLKKGKVKPVPGDEIEAYFAKSTAHRSRRS